MKQIFMLLTAIGLSGCATLPEFSKPENHCAFRHEAFNVEDPGFMRPSERPIPVPMSTLVLSGGGEKGAFGAGFLKGWAERAGGRLPDFDLVTGISTGAILATWAFIGDHQTMATEYRIEKESQILNAYSKPTGSGGLGFSSAIALLRKNSLGDLTPLRDRLRTLLDAELLRKVAQRSGQLKIGAVEVDTGDLQLFDMKHMAAKAVAEHDAGNPPGFERFRNCYADAIIASSSVPLGAKPVFIDNRMYVDGGVRQGIFVDYLSKIQRQNAYLSSVGRQDQPYRNDPGLQTRDTSGKIQAPRIYAIMNGTQWADRECGRLDEANCNMTNHFMPDGVYVRKHPHRKWQIATLAFRSSDILGNQIYRFSLKRTEEQYRLLFPEQEFRQRFYFARMHRTHLKGNARGENPFLHTIGGVTKSCPDWRKADHQDANPLQFHPRYMACLMAYGESEAARLEWYVADKPSQFEGETMLE